MKLMYNISGDRPRRQRNGARQSRSGRRCCYRASPPRRQICPQSCIFALASTQTSVEMYTVERKTQTRCSLVVGRRKLLSVQEWRRFAFLYRQILGHTLHTNSIFNYCLHTNTRSLARDLQQETRAKHALFLNALVPSHLNFPQLWSY